jgi:hypothetical protein
MVAQVIVAPLFEGDADEGLMAMQHDSYHSAISRLLDAHNRFAHFIAAVTGDGVFTWAAITSCDHRTLQDAHDILAAAWRYRTDIRQPPLPIQRDSATYDLATTWLKWLHAELEGWFEAPYLVRQLHEVLSRQNTPLGDAAEVRMAYTLIFDRFPDVPWLPEAKAAASREAEQVQPENGGTA